MDLSVHLDNQRSLMTIEIDNKAINNLLPSKVKASQLVAAQQTPKDFFRRRHIAPKQFGSLLLCRVDALANDNVGYNAGAQT